MSEIVGFVGMSHSPFATLLPPPAPTRPGGRFLADAARVRDAVARAGAGRRRRHRARPFPRQLLRRHAAVRARRRGGRGLRRLRQPRGPAAGGRRLAWSVHDGLAAAGFDLALSYALTVDHGIVQGYEMVRGGRRHPARPAGGQHRRAAAAAAARAAWRSAGRSARRVRAADAGRVLVLASGGLSHWLPSNDPRDPSVAGERRDALIHGRRDAHAFAAAREPKVRAMGGDPDAPVNAAWDPWFLEQLVAGDLDPVADLGHDGLEERAGSGGHEIRTWLIGFAAVGAAGWTSYEPVPEWITGMGIGTTFEVA